MHRLGGWRFTMHRLHTHEAWPTLTQRMSQLELLPEREGGVVLLGDSHVANGEWGEWFGALSVHNRGIPGATLPYLTAFAKTLDMRAGTTVVLQIGTNDLLFDTPQAVAVGYDSLLHLLFTTLKPELGGRVIVCTLPGVGNEVRWTGLEANNVAALNEAIRGFGEREGVLVYDLAQAIGSIDGVLSSQLTDDGVHLRGEGYRKWVSGLAPLLRRGTTFAQ